LKINRVQESCLLCLNCLPQSNNGNILLSQKILRHYVLGDRNKPDSINRGHSLIKVRNRFMGTALPKPMKLHVPVYGRPMVSIIILCGTGGKDDRSRDELLSCLSNLPSSEIRQMSLQSSSLELSKVISETTSDLICVMEHNVRVGGTWIMDLCGMMTSPDVGAVGPRMTLTPFPHVRKLILSSRRIFLDTGLFPRKSGDRWENFDACMKQHGYLVRQSLTGNIRLGE